MLSLWEKNSFLEYDYIIIGSGMLGLSTACSIKEKDSSSSVLILERGIFPSGASTKNAGFASFGSLTEILSNFINIGEKETISLVEKRLEGLSLLIKRLGKERMGFHNYGGYELITEKQLNACDKIDYINVLLKHIFQTNIFEIKNDKIMEFGFQKSIIRGLVYNRWESQIDTGLMMCSLIDYATSLGIKIINGSGVTGFNETKDHVDIEVKSNISNENILFVARKVIICTNAFSCNLIPELNITPARGQVLVTKPVSGLKFKGVFHFDEGYYYFRNYNERVIFGGGRNLDFEGETTHEFEMNNKIINDLKDKLTRIILPGQKYEIDYCWTGIMGFNSKKTPEIKRLSDRIIFSLSCNGMGIALSSYVGKETINYL